MSSAVHRSGLVGRVIAEHRRVVYGLVAGLVVNAIVYAFVVRPLQINVANVEQRTRTAEQALAAARAEQAQAQGTLTGKDQAVDALATFYGDVLAPDLPGARRLTYARLAQLAERSNVTYQRGTYDPVEERGSTLTRLKVSMDLTGSYADIRAFIHDVETAPEFVVIDNVLLADVGGGGALRLSLELSTYFRNTAS